MSTKIFETASTDPLEIDPTISQSVSFLEVAEQALLKLQAAGHSGVLPPIPRQFKVIEAPATIVETPTEQQLGAVSLRTSIEQTVDEPPTNPEVGAVPRTYKKRKAPTLHNTPRTQRSNIPPGPNFKNMAPYVEDYDTRDSELLALLERFKEYPSPITSRLLRAVENLQYQPQDPTDDVADDYLHSTNRYRLLERYEVTDLFKRINNGLEVQMGLNDRTPTAEETAVLTDAAACYEVIYNCNVKLVTSKALRMPGKRDPMFLDCVQEGNMGLGTAIRRFNYTKGFTFSTYATWWIKQSLQRAMANQSRTIRIPVHQEEKFGKILGTINRLMQKLGKHPTNDEVAAATGFPLELVTELLEVGRKHLKSLNAPTGSDGVTEFGDLLPDFDSELDQAADSLNQWSIISGIFESDQISALQKVILSLRFGSYSPSLEEVILHGRESTYPQAFKAAEAKIIANGRRGNEGICSLEEIGIMVGMPKDKVKSLFEQALETMAQTSLVEALESK